MDGRFLFGSVSAPVLRARLARQDPGENSGRFMFVRRHRT